MIIHEELIELGFDKPILMQQIFGKEFKKYYYKKNNNFFYHSKLETLMVKYSESDWYSEYKEIGKATTKEQLEDLINALKGLE